MISDYLDWWQGIASPDDSWNFSELLVCVLATAVIVAGLLAVVVMAMERVLSAGEWLTDRASSRRAEDPGSEWADRRAARAAHREQLKQKLRDKQADRPPDN